MISNYLYEFFGKEKNPAKEEDTAYANRGKNDILILNSAQYTDEGVMDAAIEFGTMQREAYDRVEAGDLRNYAFIRIYANGDEDVRSYYRYERWRLEKLGRVKRMYDPANLFHRYHDIPI